MHIAVGSDHAGFRLKQEIIALLAEMGHQSTDVGAYNEESSDYPDYGLAVGRMVAAGQAEAGIGICGTGVGICIAANKVPGIRAALVSEPFTARLAREHDDANVLCLGERVTGVALALECVRAWLGASFAGGRHTRRVAKIEAAERDLINPASAGGEKQ